MNGCFIIGLAGFVIKVLQRLSSFLRLSKPLRSCDNFFKRVAGASQSVAEMANCFVAATAYCQSFHGDDLGNEATVGQDDVSCWSARGKRHNSKNRTGVLFKLYI
jgi:hypothetical protein